MSDTYTGIGKVAADSALRERVIACAAQQGVQDVEAWVPAHRWEYASAPTWAEKYEYALAMGNPSPGSDVSVISDDDILTRIQQMLSP